MRILAQCTKELAQFRRDRLTVALAILLPLATLLIFGFAIRLETKNIPIVVQDFSMTPISRDYVAQLFTTNQLKPTQWSGDDPIHDVIEKGTAKAAIIIPPEFDRDIKSGRPSTIQVLIDGSDANNARLIQNSVKATTNAFLISSGLQSTNNTGNTTNSQSTSDSSEESNNSSSSDSNNNSNSQATSQGGSGIVVARTRLWFNPGRKESLYIVPGVFGVILWIFPSLLSAIAMVREKERGTILQVYTSSLSAAELLLGKLLAYFLVGIAQAVFVITLGAVLFRLWFAGDPSPFLLGTLIYLGTSVLFGLLIGTRAANQNAAVQGVATVGFLTALLLSGFIYPLSNIPFPLSLISAVLPARYYIELSRDAFVRGTGWAGIWYAPLAIAAVGVFFFNISRRVLSRMQLTD